MSHAVSEMIQSARFTPVRFRHGYDMGEVDDLLDRVSREAAQGGAVRPLIEGRRFTQVRFREGYEMAEVDDLLARVVELADS
ncbi:DivIVA domain-containing protein [Nocardioides faecalis]|nr:DivIVA domain-containing protein [Nocardioides faecalis]